MSKTDLDIFQMEIDDILKNIKYREFKNEMEELQKHVLEHQEILKKQKIWLEQGSTMEFRSDKLFIENETGNIQISPKDFEKLLKTLNTHNFNTKIDKVIND